MNNTIGIGLTTLLIFSTFLVLVVGLAGCASDNGYRSTARNDGHHESEWDRTFKPKGGGGRQFGPDDILSGQGG